VQGGGLVYVVDRGWDGSTAAAHPAGTLAYKLQNRTVLVPFEVKFFGTPAAGDWVYSESIPNIRLASAEFFVTNGFGPGAATVNHYTQLMDGGQRTLYGGQFNFQVEGILGILDDAAPALSVQQNFSIRDVYATVKGAPSGAALQVQVRQGTQVIGLCSIPDGATTSSTVNGAEQPALAAGATLSLDILSVGTTYPGRDLTVTIRL